MEDEKRNRFWDFMDFLGDFAMEGILEVLLNLMSRLFEFMWHVLEFSFEFILELLSGLGG